MRKGVHLILGVLAFFVYAYLVGLVRDTGTQTFVLGFFAVVAGSVLPDILEAPTSSRHRKIFHSKRAVKGTAMIFCITADVSILAPLTSTTAVLYAFSCFALGYLSHLLADATTKRGLPE
jgi:membrane-bound metal-dependent hydrolase YbcI (DUF457 family)